MAVESLVVLHPVTALQTSVGRHVTVSLTLADFRMTMGCLCLYFLPTHITPLPLSFSVDKTSDKPKSGTLKSPPKGFDTIIISKTYYNVVSRLSGIMSLSVLISIERHDCF